MRRALLAFAVSLLALQAWAGTPAFIANGSSTVTAGTGTCTPTMPGAATQPNDLLLLVACGEGNDAVPTIVLTTANGFTGFGGAINSSDGDALEENPEIDCRVWYKRAVGGGSDAAPVVTDSGDHTTCAVHQFRGVKTDGVPQNVFISGTDGGANDTSGVIPGETTTADHVLVVLIQGTSANATQTTNCDSVTNGDLTNITERFDSTNTSGLGGGHCMITGEKTDAGTFGDSTLTLSATTFKVAFAIGLEGGTCGTKVPLTGAGCH